MPVVPGLSPLPSAADGWCPVGAGGNENSENFLASGLSCSASPKSNTAQYYRASPDATLVCSSCSCAERPIMGDTKELCRTPAAAARSVAMAQARLRVENSAAYPELVGNTPMT